VENEQFSYTQWYTAFPDNTSVAMKALGWETGKTAVRIVRLIGHGSSHTNSSHVTAGGVISRLEQMRGAFSRRAPGRQTPLPTRIQAQLNSDDKTVDWIRKQFEIDTR